MKKKNILFGIIMFLPIALNCKTNYYLTTNEVNQKLQQFKSNLELTEELTLITEDEYTNSKDEKGITYLSISDNFFCKTNNSESYKIITPQNIKDSTSTSKAMLRPSINFIDNDLAEVDGKGTIDEPYYLVNEQSTKTYIITYSANGISGVNGLPNSQTKTHGTTLTLSNTIPTREGYEFLGWTTTSDAASVTYQAGGTYATDANITFYAVWGRNLASAIKSDNVQINTAPTLTTVNTTNSENGLYKSNNTNNNSYTYYFRGNINNNYLELGGLVWRIIRINEDETIRIILQDGINSNATYVFNNLYNSIDYMYYTNSPIKTTLNDWYNSNLISYDSKIAYSTFCEAARTLYSSAWTAGNATGTIYTSYTPTFSCPQNDGNGKGIIDNLKIGLITYDETVYAGGYYNIDNNNYYLYNNTSFWTMTTSGFRSENGAGAYIVYSTGKLYNNYVDKYSRCLRPVISLNANTIVTGNGTKNNPYVVK